MRFTDYLLNVYSPLTEGNNYTNMFNDFLGSDDTVRPAIDKYIKWARANLKKNDRIVWFLRWVRAELAGRAKHTDSDTELERINKRLGTDFTRIDLVPINNLMTNLTHYLGMPIPEIQNVVWQKQSPRELLEQLGEVESDWKEANADRNNLLSYHEDSEPEKIMSFPDGYAWFDLEKSYCSAEAKAMGHCGNANGRGTILSLRRLAKNHEGLNYWYPVLTFILHDDGFLGEMKGRNNDKPVEKYHPYIIALLKNYSPVQGIRGGGYMPEHNFKMSDLDDDVVAELKELKPGFADLDEIYRKEGMTDRLIRLIHERLPNGLGTGSYDKEHECFVVETWTNLDHFFRGIYDENAEKILDIALGEADFQEERSGSSHEAFLQTILELPPIWQEKIIARSGLRKPFSTDSLIEAGKRLVQADDAWFQLFEDVFSSGEHLKEEAWERLSQYISTGWAFSSSQVYLNIPSDVSQLKAFVGSDQPVELRCSQSAMMYYAMVDGEEEDDQYAYEVRDMARDDSYGNASWEHINDEQNDEMRREDGLHTGGHGRNSGDPWLKGLKTDDGSEALVNDFVSALQGNSGQGRINDPKQREIKFNVESIQRLLVLSGLKRL